MQQGNISSMDVFGTSKIIDTKQHQKWIQGLWPLNYKAMNGKMGPSQVYPSEVALEVQVEEILEQGGLLSSAEEGATHYYADGEAPTLEDQPYHVDGWMDPPLHKKHHQLKILIISHIS